MSDSVPPADPSAAPEGAAPVAPPQPAQPAAQPAQAREVDDVRPVPLQSVGQAASDFGAEGGEILVVETRAAAEAAAVEPVTAADMTVVEAAEEEYSPTVVLDAAAEAALSAEAAALVAPDETPAASAAGRAGPEADEGEPPAGPTYTQQLAAAQAAGQFTTGAFAAPAAPEGEGGADASVPSAPEPPNTVIVRYGLMRQLGQVRHNFDRTPPMGTKLVIRTERGVELGTVVIPVSCGHGCAGACINPGQLSDFLRANGPEYPFRRDGKILRLANPQDVIDQRHLDSSASEEGTYCRQQIKELGLNMRLVTVEHLLGGERIIFYFSSEQRVDFRELVRRLAQQYRTRIEMRQVGARDEARLVGDYERCGQRCCCQEFLKDLRPVSMRMAKTQKATLDPAKISGRCGRLMCCLRYEDAVYEDLRKKLPKKNIWVRTAELVGRVIDTHILTQFVRLMKVDGTQVVVENEEILERNVEPPPPPKEREFERKPPRDRSQMHPLRDEVGKGGQGRGPGGPGGPAAPAAREALAQADEPAETEELDELPPGAGEADAPARLEPATAASGSGGDDLDDDAAGEGADESAGAEDADAAPAGAEAGGGGQPGAASQGEIRRGGGQGGPRDDGRRGRRRRGRRGRGGQPAGPGGMPQGQAQPAGPGGGGQGSAGGQPQGGQRPQGGPRPPQQGGPQGGAGPAQGDGQGGRRGRRRRKRRPGGGGGPGGPGGAQGGGGSPQGGGGGGAPPA